LENIVGPVAELTVRLEIGQADAGPVYGNETSMMRLRSGFVAKNWPFYPASRRAVKVEYRLACWVAIFSIAKLAVIDEGDLLADSLFGIQYSTPFQLDKALTLIDIVLWVGRRKM